LLILGIAVDRVLQMAGRAFQIAVPFEHQGLHVIGDLWFWFWFWFF
jgi:hypothetical protein